jgi:hypothetical protein
MNVVLAGVDKQNAGAASGILTTMIQISQAMGVAVVGVVFFSALGVTSGSATQVAHSYGLAFIAGIVSITILAVATLICSSLLPSPRKAGAKEAQALAEKARVAKV